MAVVHFGCCYLLFFAAIGIGMKSFDSPHTLSASERVVTLAGRVMLLPIAYPVHYAATRLLTPIIAGSNYSAGVKDLVAVVWLFGPMVLNSVFWAYLVWWAYSRLSPRVRQANHDTHSAA